MKTIKYLGLAGLAAASLFASQAFASMCPMGFHGQPTCIATTNAYGEATLEQSLGAAGTHGSIFSAGNGINPYTQQLNPSSYWSVGGTGGSENTVMLTLTGNASTLQYGIFDPTDVNNKLMLFNGGAAGYTTSLKTNGAGGFAATYYASSNPLDPSSGHAVATFNSGNLFGYYLQVGNTFYYSDKSLNSNGTPRVVTYAGDGSNKIALTHGWFTPGEYLQAWEDGTDFDYNDFVVMVESVHPVPEPGALGMFGAGALLIGLFAGLRRRRENA
ncbi:PEP-CTERM sorting domain-containing protein [Rhodanobacter sp. AS-Z3]|uniref:PEP-CTERM sorting domain-containing protein n=1 Tax=Rhodanobacter sp. AS-Z3 TaxID=3031330 RepID=UPI0024796D8E|nr:PEP-CTERM sorting domain-containing protein [Rhodanobacter sp. AS-Z3]WEN15363.1 PEP-CTERM sorting domain-containing protein [Rhodanobacter sp. AS-Z3]